MSGIDVKAFEARLRRRDALLGIIGLGYVGLPMTLAACAAGFRVLGFDVNASRVADLNRGISLLKQIDNSRLSAVVADRRFQATTDLGRLDEPDAILICVPTPLGKHREPDLSYIEDTARSVAAGLRPGQLVILESTTFPGTTREIVKIILEASSLRSGVDFYLAYSPEREDPGNIDFETSRIPKVVAGDGKDALMLAQALYEQIVVRTVPVSSLDTAEAVKLTENIFRAVNIALVNELKIVFDAMGIDVFEVIEAAKTKPFGYMPFYPGPGLGGHCVPIDPFYLTWKAREHGIDTRLIELAGEINTGMPRHVVERLREELDLRFGTGLNGARILTVGVSYKKNVDDIRESPALAIMELLDGAGAEIDCHDPHFPVIPPTREHRALAGKASVPLEAHLVARYEGAVIVTDHSNVDYDLLLRYSKLVVDTRNVIPQASQHRHIVAKA